MTVSGFTFIRNGITFDYPFRESILSLLPLVDELVIAVGRSEDETLSAIRSIPSEKIRVIETVWDESLRSGGQVLAQQTNIALQEIRGDWGFYLQGDEVLHESDTDVIRKALSRYSQSHNIEGLLFNYLHFYGAYDTVGDSRKWYRREVRIIRNGIGIESWGDAQGFRRSGKKLRVAHIPARIFHYGWVKPPEGQRKKLSSFHKLWHTDDWVDREMGSEGTYIYADGGRLSRYDSTHPTVMAQRIRNAGWPFDRELSNANVSLKDRLLNCIEDTAGWRIGEYKNYVLADTFKAEA